MRKTVQLLFVLLLVGMAYLCVSCSHQEQEKSQIIDISLEQVQPQIVDAISGKPINKNIYTDYQGIRIYFCCANSQRSFESDPEKYIQKLKEQNIIRERSPEEE